MASVAMLPIADDCGPWASRKDCECYKPRAGPKNATSSTNNGPLITKAPRTQEPLEPYDVRAQRALRQHWALREPHEPYGPKSTMGPKNPAAPYKPREPCEPYEELYA